jgi:hypothetical protein
MLGLRPLKAEQMEASYGRKFSRSCDGGPFKRDDVASDRQRSSMDGKLPCGIPVILQWYSG